MNKMQTFLKGLAMGAADVVPGVSGGTIAFITGIYDTLLESIRRINPRLIKIIKEQGIKQAFIHINGSFLIILLSGILTSLFSFAGIITWMLNTHPIILWSFFFGLILMSVIHMLKKITRWDVTRFIALFSGIFFAYAIIVLHPINMEPTSLNMFFAGSIAICAMILPGISGSFILLILGMYAPLLVAAKSFDVFTLAVFSLGCLIGLLSFSHLLSWLLQKYRDITLTFLSGLMIGTLDKIWPWKEVLSWRINSKGEEVALLERNLSPYVFEQLTNTPSLITFSLVAAILGFLSVLCIEKFSIKQEQAK